jgi:hypothetical protein
MVMTVRNMTLASTVASLVGVGLVLAGCASGHAGGTRAAGTPSASATGPAGRTAAGSTAARGANPATGPSAAAGSTAHGNAAAGVVTATAAATDGSGAGRRPGALWLESVRMVSAGSGWALAFRRNPASAGSDPVLLARTSDGGRTWADVTPAAARAMLVTPDAAQALDATDGKHAYLAVSTAAQGAGVALGSGAAQAAVAVFATANGGRTWTRSAPFAAAGPPVQVMFADATHGWLLLDAGGDRAGHSLPWLYRTTDGRHWVQAASAAPPGSGGMNNMCQKLGLAFTGTTAGWLRVSCRSGDFLVQSRDGGSTWRSQPLPLAGDCTVPGSRCTVFGPQVSGGTAFVTVAPMTTAPAPALLASTDLGQVWRRIALPSGAGQYPQVRFFTPASGLLVAMGAQQALGAVFYTTKDAGRTWYAVPQGRRFTQLGASVDFANARDGVEWTEAGDAQGAAPPPLYATGDSGRTWTPVVPELTG